MFDVIALTSQLLIYIIIVVILHQSAIAKNQSSWFRLFYLKKSYERKASTQQSTNHEGEADSEPILM